MQQSPLDTPFFRVQHQITWVSLSAWRVFLVSCSQGGPRLNYRDVPVSDERKNEYKEVYEGTLLGMDS